MRLAGVVVPFRPVAVMSNHVELAFSNCPGTVTIKFSAFVVD